MKTNSKYKVSVKFKCVEDNENTFTISSDYAEAFYLICMTASGIIERFAYAQS